MATLLNSLSPITSSPSNSSRNVHVFMCKYSLTIPNLRFVSLKKGFSRILASAQMSVTTRKRTFIIPNWSCDENDGTRNKRSRRAVNYAFKHFEKMLESGEKRPHVIQGENLVYALCDHYKHVEAVRVIEKMSWCGVMPRKTCYAHLVDRLCERCSVDDAMQLIEKVGEYWYPSDNTVYNTLVRGLSRQGRLDLQVLERFVKNGFVPSALTYSVLLEAVCREKGADDAMRALDELAANCQTLSLDCYNVLLTGLCSEGRTDDAILLFGELPSKGFCPNDVSCSILVGNLCSENRWEEAIALLDEIRAEPTETTYDVLIGSLAQQGKIDAAFEVLKDMRRAGLRPKTTSYNSILAPICNEGKVDFAVKCVDQMIFHDNCGTDETYNAIAGLCKHEKALEAFTLIQRLGDIHWMRKREFYRKVIYCWCEKGNTRPAIQLFSEMKKDGPFPKFRNYYHLILTACRRAGWSDGAVEDVVSFMEEHGDRPTIDKFNSTISSLCKDGRTDLSIDLLETMIKKGYKPNEQTYLNLVEGLAQQDEKELAEDVLMELRYKRLVSAQEEVDKYDHTRGNKQKNQEYLL